MERVVTFLYQELFRRDETANSDDFDEFHREWIHPAIEVWGGTIVHQKGTMILLRFGDLPICEQYLNQLLENFENPQSHSRGRDIRIRFFLFQSDSIQPGTWEKNLIAFARKHIPLETGVFSTQRILGTFFRADLVLLEEGKKILYRLQHMPKEKPDGKSRLNSALKTLGGLVVLFFLIWCFQFLTPRVEDWWIASRYSPIQEALQDQRYPVLFTRLKSVAGDSHHPVLEGALESFGIHLWKQTRGLEPEVSREAERGKMEALNEGFPWSKATKFYLRLFQALDHHSPGSLRDLYHLYGSNSISRTGALLELLALVEEDPFFLMQSTLDHFRSEEQTEFHSLWKASLLRSLGFPLAGKELFYADLLADQDLMLEFPFLKKAMHSENPVTQSNAFRLLLLYSSPTPEEVLIFLRIQTRAGREIHPDLRRLAGHRDLQKRGEYLRVLKEFSQEVAYDPRFADYLNEIKDLIQQIKEF